MPHYAEQKIDARQKQFFNERAEAWLARAYCDAESGGCDKLAAAFQRLFSLVQVNEGDCVLDVGCGIGVLVPHLLSRIGKSGRLIELDYAENMIAANKRLHKDRRIEFVNADVVELTIEEGACDLVICFSCFPHFIDKPGAIRKMAAALKRGGRLAIAHFQSSKELNEHHGKTAAVMHAHMPEQEGIKGLFEKARLKPLVLVDEPGFLLALAEKP